MTISTIMSRREALELGLKRFYNGKPCSRGHLAERFTCNGACSDCLTFKTPSKVRKVTGTNVGWPAKGLVFHVGFTPTREEVEACFNYIEACGWHDVALQAVHDDPVLLAKHIAPLSGVEKAALHGTDYRLATRKAIFDAAAEYEEHKRNGTFPRGKLPGDA